MKTNLFYKDYIKKIDLSYDCIVVGLKNDDDARKSIDVFNDLKKKFIKTKLFIIFDFENLLKEEFRSNFLIINDIGECDSDYRILIKEKLLEFKIKTVNIFLSGLERELILILVFLLEKWEYVISVTHITCDKYDSYKIEKYKLPPQNLMFFSGNLQLTKPSALIIMPGYEKEAVKIFVNYYEPSALFIGRGNIEPLELEQNIKEEEIVQELKELYRNPEMSIDEFNYSPSDIDQTFSALKTLTTFNNININFNNYNVILACCSTKLATISMYLFHKYYPNSQVVYLDAEKTIKTTELKRVIVYNLPMSNSEES